MIRTAKFRDLPRLALIGIACTTRKDHYVRLEMLHYPVYLLANKIFVCVHDGKIQGYILRGMFVNVLGHCFVNPLYRGQGIGKALIRYMTKKYPGISLFCRPHMQEYYQNLGFKMKYVCMKHEAEK